MQTKILLVEDEKNFGSILKDYLKMNGFAVELCEDGEQGLTAFKASRFDLCIIDVMMPKKDGFTLAKDIRMLNTEIPIIFLTAKSMKDDVIEGFKIVREMPSVIQHHLAVNGDIIHIIACAVIQPVPVRRATIARHANQFSFTNLDLVLFMNRKCFRCFNGQDFMLPL